MEKFYGLLKKMMKEYWGILIVILLVLYLLSGCKALDSIDMSKHESRATEVALLKLERNTTK